MMFRYRKLIIAAMISILLYISYTIHFLYNSDSLTLSYLFVDKWWKHQKYGAPPSPFNAEVAWYILENQSDKKYKQMENELGVGIDGILSLQWDEKNRDARKIIKLASLFMRKGLSENYINKRTGCSAIHQALSRNDSLAIKFLMSRGANLNYFSEEEYSPKFCRISPDEYIKINRVIYGHAP